MFLRIINRLLQETKTYKNYKGKAVQRCSRVLILPHLIDERARKSAATINTLP